MSDSTSSESQEPHRFLSPERIVLIGKLIEPLIRDGLSWIERRREHVTILDDTALRRQISVDFSLRRTTTPIPNSVPAGSAERLYCAPVFMLPKSPANLMAFDLFDETGQSLRVVSRVDNAQISGVTLCAMAERILSEHGRELSPALAVELRQIAEVDADEGKQRARRVEHALQPEYASEAEILSRDQRFCWWLSALAHSSILIVIFRALTPRRKIIKLAFEQPIESELKWRTSLGWDQYEVWVDSPLIEARTYHFEAEAPPGLRITEAKLSDDGHESSVKDHGFLRRVHLYREDAAQAGAGTAVMRLCVGASFGSGAFLSAALTTAALLGAAVFASNIATNPTSAPTLLLFLPGLIATYIARPEQHPLTTRLLWGARRLLLGIALLAYAAAARVALSGGQAQGALAQRRASELRVWLYPSSFIAAVLLVALGITYLRVRRQTVDWGGSDHSIQRYVAATAEQVFSYLSVGSLCPHGYELVDAQPALDTEPGRVSFLRGAWHGNWTMTVTVSTEPEAIGEPEAGSGQDGRSTTAYQDVEVAVAPPACWVTVDGSYTSRVAGAMSRWLLTNDRPKAQSFLAKLQDWATELSDQTADAQPALSQQSAERDP